MKLQHLFSDPSKWTRGYFARTKDGDPVLPNDPDAECWCLSGGVRLCYPPEIDPLSKYPDYVTVSTVLFRISKYLEEKGEYDKLHEVHGTTPPAVAVWNDYLATFEKIQQLVKELDI